jgi:uncharacterized protein YgbK (DUF1537 family)
MPSLRSPSPEVVIPLRLGAVADDYTGASDLANTLTRNGLATMQTIGVPSADLDLVGVEAVVIALKIRSVEAPRAVAAALAAYDWLAARGARHVMYKVCSTFDSTDAGNIGPVTDAFRQRASAGCALVTPAFPETGRTVYRGHLFVGDVPLNESPLKDHPLNPMRDSDLKRVLSRQSASPVGLVDLATVARGASAIAKRLKALEAEGFGAAIVDAVFESDLEAIGEAAARQPISTGASGVGLGLARALRRGAGASAASLDPVGGSAAIIAGSCSNATLDQIAAAESEMPVLRLDAERLMDGRAETARALAWAQDRLNAGAVLIASSADPERVSMLQARFGREAAGQSIERALAEIAAGLVEGGVRRLIVAGGETSGAVVDRLGVEAFRLGPEIAPGVPLLRTVGRAGGELQMALKSGNFGGRDFFGRSLAMTR